MREAIRSEVESIIPFDDLEARTRTEVIMWIDSGVELCRLRKPDKPSKHLVSYFVLVDGDYVLLVDHINARLWLPTGGHVEPGEHPRDTVLREAREELSIQGEFLFENPVLITSAKTVGRTAGHTDVSIWYILRGNRKQSFSFDRAEFNSICWFHKEQIPYGRADPAMARFLAKLYTQIAA